MAIKKRTKREESMIVLWNVFFWLLTIWLIVWIFTYILPNYNEINTLKTQAFEEKQKLETYKKEWIPFSKLKDYSGNTEIFWENLALKNQVSWILSEMTDELYNKTLKNTKEADYQTFIKKKLDSYKEDKNSEEILDMTSKILPLYDKSIWEKGQITEFEFINYVESIIATFNLRYKNSIWINNLSYLEEYKLTNSDNSFDKWISQIPIELDIVWNKSSILDFLYFIENVWKVELSESGEIIINVPENNELFNFRNKKLEKDRYKQTENYNIFDNQIIDVESIEFKDSIDWKYSSPTITENGNEFLKYIKETQEKERFEVKIKINFYVKWLPKYKVDEFNVNFTKKLNSVDSSLTRLLAIPRISWNDKSKLKNIKTSVDNIKSSTQEQAWWNNNENENALIQKFQNNTLYMEILEWYEKEIKEIDNKINKK